MQDLLLGTGIVAAYIAIGTLIALLDRKISGCERFDDDDIETVIFWPLVVLVVIVVCIVVALGVAVEWLLKKQEDDHED